MKKVTALIIFSLLFMVLGIPAIVLMNYEKPIYPTNSLTQTVAIYDSNTKRVVKIPLEDYIVGVVAAEMPANFQMEALKAQAVAARTYTVKRMYRYGAKPDELHPNAELCIDPIHCQAWADSKTLKRRWGKLNYYLYINKIKNAVLATKGEVISYNGSLIDPVYHGSCGGQGTENSEEVWGNFVPYLRGVDCKYEYKKENQKYTVTKTKSDLITAFNNGGTIFMPVSTKEESSLKYIKKTNRGRILKAEYMGKMYTGNQIRQMVGLTSTLVRWKSQGNNVVFTSIGKGHAVGMCQYGANGMALKGDSYKQILFHYYSNVKLVKIK